MHRAYLSAAAEAEVLQAGGRRRSEQRREEQGAQHGGTACRRQVGLSRAAADGVACGAELKSTWVRICHTEEGTGKRGRRIRKEKAGCFFPTRGAARTRGVSRSVVVGTTLLTHGRVPVGLAAPRLGVVAFSLLSATCPPRRHGTHCRGARVRERGHLGLGRAR